MLAQAVTQTLTAFNLICSVTTSWLVQPKPIITQRQIVFRIDLGSSQFCEGTCVDVLPLPFFDDKIIWLDEPEVMTDNGVSNAVSIDRKASTVHGLKLIPYAGSLETKGPCVTAPFSGFPQPD
jgi:hypothetical protein